MGQRPIASWVSTVGLLLLGLLAASRLPLSYLPGWNLPEVLVELDVGEALDADELGRRFVVPLEAAIRASGQVRGVVGEVAPSGAYFRVRYAAGVDSRRKAARLDSEAATLLRELPENGRLEIWPSTQGAGDRAAVLWLGNRDEGGVERAFVEALRALPEVRSAIVAGQQTPELRVTPHGHETQPRQLHAAIERWLGIENLGALTHGGLRRSVWARSPGLGTSHGVRHGATLLPLVRVADLALGTREAPFRARLDGRPGRVVVVEREPQASPLALEKALYRTLRRFDLDEETRFLVNEADLLRRLLERLALGVVVAMLIALGLGAFLAGLRSGLIFALALPLAISAGLNALWLGGLPLDVTTLPALALGVFCSLFFTAMRQRRTTLQTACSLAVSALMLSVAIALAGGRLAPLLAVPGRAFVYCLVAAILAQLALPPLPRLRQGHPTLCLWRFAWRHAVTLVLAVGTAAYVLYVVAGQALMPHPTGLAPATSDLAIRLTFAEGGLWSAAEARIATFESHLAELPEIDLFWSLFDRRQGLLLATVRREDRNLVQLRHLAARLTSQTRGMAAAVRIVPLGSAASRQGQDEFRFSENLEDRPETDKEATTYRFILRSTELEILRRAHLDVQEQLSAVGIRRRRVTSDWAAPTVRLELEPRADAAPEQVKRATQELRRRAQWPSARPLPGSHEAKLRVMSSGSPQDEDEIVERSLLLDRQGHGGADLPAPSALFAVREVTSSPTIKRQSGRFVLPVTVRFGSLALGKRQIDRETVDRALAQLALPPGCDLERPSLNPFVWSPERWRLLAIASILPMLLLAWACIRTSSLVAGLVALLPAVVALAAVAPLVLWIKGYLDEMTLMALAAALTPCLGVALEVSSGVGTTAAPRSVAAAHGWLLDRGPWILAASLVAALGLAVPGLGLDNDRQPWVMPLGAAALAILAANASACFLSPAALRGAQAFQQRDRVALRQRARPPIWDSRGAIELRARRLTKIYGDGFRALRSVDFCLHPGIVGLLGPNGAGKTTLMRLLCGLLEPSRGQVLFRGVPITAQNLARFRHLVGFLPQSFNAYEGFTASRFLDYWALERGIHQRAERQREVERLLVQVGLEDVAGRKVRDLSGGMRRRIGIARALLGSPPILIVDEPTTGLDIESRQRLRDSLLSVAGERVVLFSTHIASDLAAAASRILLLHQGRLLFDGAVGELIALARGRVFEAVANESELGELSRRYRVTARVRTLEGIHLRAVAQRGEDVGGELVEPDLEEAYLAITAEHEASQRRGEHGPRRSWLDLAEWR